MRGVRSLSTRGRARTKDRGGCRLKLAYKILKGQSGRFLVYSELNTKIEIGFGRANHGADGTWTEVRAPILLQRLLLGAGREEVLATVRTLMKGGGKDLDSKEGEQT